MATTDHVGDSAGGARDDVLAIVEFADVFSDIGAADAGVALNLIALGPAQRAERGTGRLR